MSDGDKDFGGGPGNTIGRGAEDVGGIGSAPGAVPDDDAGDEGLRSPGDDTAPVDDEA